MPLSDISQSRVTGPLLATPARQRMTVLASTTVLMSFAAGGFDFLCPLWVVRGLGYSESQWAQMRSLRFTGVLLGVILLGALSDRFGQRRIAAIALFGMAVVLGLLGCGWQQGIWVLMPIHGAFASTVYVNLNTLIQGVSARRQGLANTIYRGAGAATGILAPVAVTWLAVAWRGYPVVMLALAVVFIASGLVLLYHPNDVAASPLGPLRQEVRQLWSGYRVALRQRGLMNYIHVSQIWGNVLIGVNAFGILRLTRELGQTDQQAGLVGTIAGLAALLGTVGAGIILDRVSLRNMHIVIGLVTGVSSLLMGVGNMLGLSIVAFILYSAMVTMSAAPMSMWVSRAAGESTQTAAFSIHKVFSALYVTASMVLVGYLEKYTGMRVIFLYGGILGTLAALLYFLLPEPPPPTYTRK